MKNSIWKRSVLMDKKGITLASLTIYVVVATVVISILAYLNTQFFSNINELNNESKIVSEDLTFKAALIRDLKGSDNVDVAEYSSSLIRLTNNTQYEIRKIEDGNADNQRYAIYRNDVQLAKGIVPFSASEISSEMVVPHFDYDASSKTLKVNVKFSDGINNYLDKSSFLVGQQSSSKSRVNNDYQEAEVKRYYIIYSSNDGNNATFVDSRQEGSTIRISGNEFLGLDKSDYELIGWATTPNGPVVYEIDAEYTGEDITLYAVWNRIQYRFDGQIVLDGTNYLSTEVKLFSELNAHRNFIASFTIDELGEGNAHQSTVFACNNEVGYPYQGAGFRFFKVTSGGVTTDMYQYFANCFVQTEKRVNIPLDGVNIVSLLRIDDVLYYRYNNLPFKVLLDFTGFENYIDVPATFGASRDAHGNYYRFFKGKVSKVYIKIDESLKLSDFPGEEPEHPNMTEVFSREGVVIFNGTSDYINTGLKLFNSTNKEKDFEISFTVNSYTPQANQPTIINSKYENAGAGYPGFVFRYNSNSGTAQIANRGGTGSGYSYSSLTYPYHVKIYRTDMVLYIQINDNAPQKVTDYSSANLQFDTELTIGCTTINGAYQRFARCELQDISIYLEDD